VQVVPDVPTFAVDDGFSYAVPDTMALHVGSVVRVPLGGRRVRGWVTDIRDGSQQGLKSVIGVSGAYPVFTPDLLQILRWAAIHYVAPLPVMLSKSAPPNLPAGGGVELPALVPGGAIPSEVEIVLDRIESGQRAATTFVPGSGPWAELVGAISGAAAVAGGSTVVVLPTAHEAQQMEKDLKSRFGRRVIGANPALSAAQRTTAWSQAHQSPGSILVGTPEVALWPHQSPGAAVIVEEGRRAMKSRQSPTVHVRDLMRRRAAVERTSLIVLGQVPTLELIAAGAVVAGSERRAWPLVELIDRNAEPPSSSLIGDGLRAAIGGAIRRSEPVFVFVSRRGYAPAFRCTKCGELRRCPSCGSSPGRGELCDRCRTVNVGCLHCGGTSFAPLGAGVGRVIEDLRRSFGERVTDAAAGGLVAVGTERDIPPAGSTALSAAVDADSMLLRPHYRAEEDALRILSRVAATVRRGRGHRCVVQTRVADHRVLSALRSGRSDDLVAKWMDERSAEQLPPVGELVAIELRDPPDGVDDDIRSAAGDRVAVFGPAESRDRLRWLVQAPDLRPFKIRLRHHAQSWRDRGAMLRVDSDPLDV